MKTLVWFGAIVGGLAGGYVPVLFGSDYFSVASIVGNTVGGLLGIAAAYRIARFYGV